jgi:glycosyltransferase involved in cell wall biosynthesis/2-polyprenyl-3-methyl-5-hydroxy-6-metoxy-1,4-benzoquinol methylase
MSAKRWDRFVPYTHEDVRAFTAQGTAPVVVQRIRLERDREALYTMDLFLYNRAQHRRMVLQFLTLNTEQGNLRVDTPSILEQLDKAWYQLMVDALSQVVQEMVRNPQLFEQPILVASLNVPDDVPPLDGAGQNRVAPGFAWNELYIHSAKRYLFAAEFCKGGLVLDLGCGSGYGAKFLARTAQQVIAADMDPFALQYGEETYPDPRIQRIHVSPEQNLPFETHHFDAIVSLEVVEHVPVEQMEAYFAEIGRLLKPDGVLIMSTPNKQIYIHYPDPYHVSLMTLDEFRALLESRFHHVELYGQLRSQGLPHTTMEFEIVPDASDSNEIFVAVCRGYRGAECPIVLPPPTIWEHGARNPSRTPITVIVHTRNEERNIEACLASVKDWADEIIVMDMESTDRTVEIARRYTDKIFSHPLIRDFDAARNVSAQHASHEWILYLDADERMTPKLAQAITQFIQQAPPEVAGVRLPYRNYFLGHWIRHAGGWYPGYKAPMLLRRGRFRWRARVHEGVEVQGAVLLFPADDPTCAIEHYTDPTLAHFFQKLNHYSESEADKLQELNAPCTWQAIAEAFAEDFRFYYDETEGKRDGAFGFLLSLCSGLSRMSNWMKYAERLLLTGHSGESLLPPSAADFLQHAANHARSSPSKPCPQPTVPPPDWWHKLWQRLQREPGSKLLYIGRGNGNHWGIIARDGWQICTTADSILQIAETPLTETVELQLLPSTASTCPPTGTPAVDSLVALGSEWRSMAGTLKQGGLFLIGASPQPKDIEQWRREIETALEATVHLVDPEPACNWLFAFGWKGQRMTTIRRTVLMVAHQHAFEMFGGGETQLLETLIALREQGVRADVSLSLRLQPQHYDLLHLFSLYHAEKLSRLQEANRPVVVSTIFWDYAELRYATTVKQVIFSHSEPEIVHRALEAWREGALRLEGIPEDHFQEPEPLRESQRAVLACAHLLLPNGEREAAMLKRAFGDVPIPIRIVPNAVRPERFLHASPEPFVKRFGLRDFVLCAARLEPNKNQAMLIWALRDTGLPLVIAGAERDPDYARLCRKWAGASVQFVGELSPDMLASAYAAARVHALPSWSETPGLANLEAGLAGCALVVGNRGLEQEYLGEYAFVCDPGDWRSIREAVLQAWESANPTRIQACREHILRHFTWEQVARLTADVYESLLKNPVYWVALPHWDDTTTWQPLVEAYVRSANPAKGTVLQLYAGPLNNTIPEEGYERVKDFLLQLGIEPANCPDIEIVNQLVAMPGALAILTGSPLDAPLQQLFGDRCITFQEWQKVA